MGKRGRRPSVRYWQRQGGGYFCKHDGRQVCLARGPDDATTGPTYLAALEAYGKLLASQANKGTDGFALSALFDAYRSSVEKAERRSMLNNMTHFLKPFCDRHGGLAVASLKGFHVREWIEGAATWGPSSRRLAVKLLAGMLNWGVKDGLIQSNPLKGRIDLPQDKPRGRECRLSPDFADLLIERARPAFRMLLRMWRGTGARPEEIERCEAFNYADGKIIYPFNATRGYVHKQARRGQKKDRIIFLTPELTEIVESQVRRHPSGPIFRTPRGKSWRIFHRLGAWNSLLSTKQVAEYLDAHGINREHIVPYSFRHTFISEWIETGRSIKVCADLCGTSVAMIEKHYGHPNEGALRELYLDFMRGR